MRILSTSIAVVIWLFTSASGVAADPYEFIACSYKEGKGAADLDRWVAASKEVLDSAGDDYSAVVLTPQYADGDQLPDFYWMGKWPTAEKLGVGLGSWFEQGKGDKAMAALAKIADCPSASLWWGRTVYTQSK